MAWRPLHFAVGESLCIPSHAESEPGTLGWHFAAAWLPDKISKTSRNNDTSMIATITVCVWRAYSTHHPCFEIQNLDDEHNARGCQGMPGLTSRQAALRGHMRSCCMTRKNPFSSFVMMAVKCCRGEKLLLCAAAADSWHIKRLHPLTFRVVHRAKA